MKKMTFILALFCLPLIGWSQSAKEEIDLVQSVFGMEKKAVVASFIKLEGAQKDAFWKTYDAYETERKELGKKRIDVLNKYAANYATLDDAKTDEIIKDIMNLQVLNDKLITTYYKKLKKEAGSKAAAQFYQIEGYILSKIRTSIMESIPMIGELDQK
jgi:hypothetical protein